MKVKKSGNVVAKNKHKHTNKAAYEHCGKCGCIFSYTLKDVQRVVVPYVTYAARTYVVCPECRKEITLRVYGTYDDYYWNKCAAGAAE